MRVLIVEDEPEIRQAIGRRLRAEGHAADEAEDIATAESFVATYHYDVIVLDRGLPDGEGLEQLRKWRTRGIGCPTLFLTARDRLQDRVDGFEGGGDDYLVKPFAMAELLARLFALARRGSEARPSLIRIGDLELDLGRREVRLEGVLLPLRPKEYALLELLVTRAGRVVSRRQILESLWGEDHEPNSNVEEVVIAALRRKLGSPALIRTVRGAGYLIEATNDETAIAPP